MDSPVVPQAAAPPRPFVEGRVAPIETSRGYLLGLCVVAAAMILLPAIYLALTAAVAYAVGWHTVTHNKWPQSPFFIHTVFYFVPLVSGCALFLFMLKPLFHFFSRGEEERSFDLSRDDAPELHRLIDEVARALGAPPPDRVVIDLRPNASAGIKRSWFGFRRENVLTLGLPLLLTMNVRQVAGVVAHECRHLAQPMALRLARIIHAVNYWLAYSVYGPHFIDELIEWSSEVGPLMIIVIPIKFCVWVTRGVLRLLMLAGWAVSGYMLRQMEIDADALAAQISGAHSEREVLTYLDTLTAAVPFIEEDLELIFRRKLFPESLAPLVMANERYALAAGLRRLRSYNLGGYYRYLQSHPSDAERIAAAERDGGEGQVRDERPAGELFKDFATFNARFTKWWFSQWLETPPTDTTDNDEFLRRVGKDRDSAAALARCLPSRETMLFLPLPETLADGAAPTELLERFRRAWRESVSNADERDDAAMDLRSAREHTASVRLDAALMANGLKPAAKIPSVKESDAELRAALTPTAEALALALRIERTEGSTVRGEGFDADETKRVDGALQCFSRVMPALVELYDEHVVTVELFVQLSTKMRLSRIAKVLRPRLTAAMAALVRVREALGDAPFPFDHPGEEMTLRRYLLQFLPEEIDLGVMACSDELLHKSFPLYQAVLGRAALLAESIERADAGAAAV